ncbi:hypothetical protein BJ742DRAFT_846713 [Cladochytrium replicatum]|nr:hypothetical protein BJ742DRAFT_846713 [Cladochytrium replicatum]
MHLSLILVVGSLASSVLGQVVVGTTKYDLYSKRRKDFDAFVSYAPDTRQYVANSIEKMFGIYPSLDSKLANYGARSDYRPVLSDLVANAKTYTDREFHLKMAKMITSLRDFHTNYFMPYPHGCATVLLPIRFDLSKTDDQINNPRPAVVSRSAAAVRALTPEVEQIQFGDILEIIDGLTFKEFFDLVQDDQNGANLSGGYRSTATYVSRRFGDSNAFPDTDNTTLTLARYDLAGNLVTRYTITLPWLIAFDTQTCEPTITWPSDPPLRVQQNNTRVSIDEKTKKNLQTPIMKNDRFEKMLADYPDVGYQIPYTPTPSTILGWTKYRADSCNIGIIRLASFSPSEEVYKTEEFIYLFQSLLANQLADTDGLVIDITSNGGGFVFIADELPQLFLRRGKVSIGGSRGIVTPVNTELVVNLQAFGADDYYQAYVKALQNGDKYTEPIPFTAQADANKLGTAYIKPVVVFNNGNCYSACDLFSAHMQDNDLAFIIGEDKQTGAGGANVFALSDLSGAGFPGIDVLQTGQDARVGYRQYVRLLKNAGEFIEDRGIIADRGNVKLSIRDIQDNTGPLYENLDQIAGFLNTAVHRKGIYESKFSMSPIRAAAIFANSPSPFVLKIANFDSYKLFDKDTEQLIEEKSLGRSPGVDDATVKTLNIDLPAEFLATPALRAITVQAWRDGVQYVETHRTIKIYPGGKVSSFPFTWDFTSYPANNFAAIYTTGNPANGWNRQNGQLIIGNGVTYVNNLDTSAVLILAVPTGAAQVSVQFSGQVNSESGYDFLNLSLFDPAADTTLATFFNVAGTGTLTTTRAASVAGKSVVGLNLRFTSDPAVVQGFGVKVTTFKVSFA